MFTAVIWAKKTQKPQPRSLIHFNLHKSSNIEGKEKSVREKKRSGWNIFISVQVNNFPLDLRKTGSLWGLLEELSTGHKAERVSTFYITETESKKERETERMYGGVSYDKELGNENSDRVIEGREE